jgi:Sulfotransferase domain
MTTAPTLPPNFLVLGAPRAATTSLHYYLAQHPDVCMSTIKEPNYFLFDHDHGERPFVVDDPRITAKSVSNALTYSRLFPNRTTAVGEASPLYLYTEQTPDLVARTLPGVRVIAVLRQPADRALSHFSYLWKGGPGLLDGFAAAVETELPLTDTPFRPGTHNLRLGRYAAQLQRWEAVIDRDRMLVLDYADVTGSPAATMRRVSDFLGVDAGFGYDTETKYNPSAAVTSDALSARADRLIRPLIPYVKRALPAGVAGKLAHRRARFRATSAGNAGALAVDANLPPALAETLDDYFAHDVEWVGAEFGIDLRRVSRDAPQP